MHDTKLIKQKNAINFARVCDKMQLKYDGHIIRNINKVLMKDSNAIIGLNEEDEIMLWCSASRIGRRRYKFNWADECITFKSAYVPYKHLRCSSCDLLNARKFPCHRHYHFFANIKVHSKNIVNYMNIHHMNYKIEN